MPVCPAPLGTRSGVPVTPDRQPFTTSGGAPEPGLLKRLVQDKSQRICSRIGGVPLAQEAAQHGVDDEVADAIPGVVFFDELIETGADDYMIETAMLKVFASDQLWRIVNDCLQIWGGKGFFTDEPFERMMRDAKITQIYEGTNQVQRIVMARKLLGQY